MRRRIDPRHSAPPPTVRPPPLAWPTLALIVVLSYWLGGWPATLAGAVGFLLGIHFDDLIGAWR